jgi:hypothetical protein
MSEPKPSISKRRSRRSKNSDGRRVREIDDLIARIKKLLPKAIRPALSVQYYRPVSPTIFFDPSARDTDRKRIDRKKLADYFAKYANPDLVEQRKVEEMTALVKDAGILAGAPAAKAARHWMEILRRSEYFRPLGFLNNVPQATVEMLQYLKNTGTLPPPAPPPPVPDEEAKTFDLDKWATWVEPYVLRPYPMMLYNHSTGEHKVVNSSAERRQMAQKGWSPHPSAGQKPAVRTKAPRGAPEKIAANLKDQALKKKNELEALGKKVKNVELAQILYQIPNPSSSQKRSVGTILKNYVGKTKRNSIE